MTLTIIDFIWGIDAILALICGIRVFQVWQRTKDKLLGDFTKFFILGGVGYLVLSGASSFIKNIFELKLAITLGVFVMFVGLAYFAKLVVRLVWAKFESSTFWLIIFGDILTLIANIKYYLLVPTYFPLLDPKTGLAPTRTQFLDPQTGIFTINFPVVASAFIIIISLITLLVPGTIFIKKAVKVGDKNIRARAMLLGCGLLFFGIGGMLCGFASRALPMYLSHLFLVLGFLPFLAGVFYVIEKKIPGVIPPVKSTPVPSIKW
jgi:hypothetical protein